MSNMSNSILNVRFTLEKIDGDAILRCFIKSISPIEYTLHVFVFGTGFRDEYEMIVDIYGRFIKINIWYHEDIYVNQGLPTNIESLHKHIVWLNEFIGYKCYIITRPTINNNPVQIPEEYTLLNLDNYPGTLETYIFRYIQKRQVTKPYKIAHIMFLSARRARLCTLPREIIDLICFGFREN